MENIVSPDNDYPFERIKIKTPKALQGGTYNAKLLLDDSPILIQTPKCRTKNGIHKTVKQIYCDILMNQDHNEFIGWLRQLQEKVRTLILDNAENWFHEAPTLDEIEYNWNNAIRIYKQKNYLIRTFVHKNKNINTPALQIFDTEEVQLDLDDLTSDCNIVCILEIMGLKFSSQSFHLEICLRQVMVINEKPIFEKCLIKLNKTDKINKTPEGIGDVPQTLEENNDSKEVEKQKLEEQKLEEQEEDIIKEEIDHGENVPTDNIDKKNAIETTNTSNNVEQVVENVSETQCVSNTSESITECDEATDMSNVYLNTSDLSSNSITSATIEVVEDKKVLNNVNVESDRMNIENNKIIQDKSKNNLDNNNEKSESKKHLEDVNNLEEITLEIENNEPITLKKPNEVYLDIYRLAREKAKKAKNAAIKAYLEAKRIKDLYLLDIVDSSDEEEDEFEEEEDPKLFSEN